MKPISIDNQSIRVTYRDLIDKKEAIRSKIESDAIDKELLEAEMEVEKAINIRQHKKEIMNRPRK